MSDLYSGLINTDLYKGKNGENFWGDFDNLDGYPNPKNPNYLAIQIQGLQALEKGRGQKQYKNASEFLKAAESRLMQSDFIQKEIANQGYQRVIELINSGLKGSKINPYRTKRGLSADQRKAAQQAGISSIMSELSEILKKLDVSKPLSARIIDTVEQRLNSFDWNKSQWQYIFEKAGLIEELAADAMNKNSALQAFVTGAWVDEKGKQLIEDVFAFLKNSKENSIPFEGGALKFFITIDGVKSDKLAISVQDFINQLNQINGVNFKVSLTDDLYKALKEAAAITTQVKSGLAGQNILNRNKRNALTLQEINFDPRKLWELYQEDLMTRTQFFKDFNEQNSQDLAAICNYCLSKNIAKTALKENQVYFTSDGFVSASQWMKKYQKYLVFTPDITKVGSSFLSDPRIYYFNE